MAGGLMLGLMTAGPVGAQAPAPGMVAPQIERCLHGNAETAVEKERRTEALAAMRMIDHVFAQGIALSPSLTWERLASQPGVGDLKRMDGRVGALANKLAWGASEPLPGWRISWVQAPQTLQNPAAILFALTDVRDSCRFRYSSNDPDVIQTGRGGVRLLPLERY
jgi:hypothetical protein